MQQPIGVFDSGIGGTSIWKEIITLLPCENTIYVADSANAPYGLKSPDVIVALSQKITQFLLDHHCKMIVVACNTATTNAIAFLRNKFSEISFIGIEPAIKPAALQSATNTIGVLATKGTLASSLFQQTAKTFASNSKVIEVEGNGLVELIENGQLHSQEIYSLLQKYLTPMITAGIDTLVLGCTHYPYLIPKIRRILPANVQIIDSGRAVAKQTKAILLEYKKLGNSSQTTHTFYTNGNMQVLKKVVGKAAGNLIFKNI